MNKKDPFGRLFLIISAILIADNNQEESAGLSIRDIAGKLDIPISVVREDVGTMLKNKILGSMIIYTEDEFDGEQIAESLLKGEGRFDEMGLMIERSDLNIPYDEIPLFLSGAEKAIMRHTFGVESIDTPLFIKDPDNSMATSGILQVVQNAIDMECKVEFNYLSTRTGKAQNIRTSPRSIYEDNLDNIMYMVSSDGNSNLRLFNFNRILPSSVVMRRDLKAAPMAERTADELQEKLKYMWGGDMGGKEPTHVKVRIDHLTKNIISKVKSETKGRACGRLYEDPEHPGKVYFYEDDVMGMSAFKSWVMMYGKSMTVLEPISLAKSICSGTLNL